MVTVMVTIIVTIIVTPVVVLKVVIVTIIVIVIVTVIVIYVGQHVVYTLCTVLCTKTKSTNTDSVPSLAQRTKSASCAHDKIALRTLYQQCLRDTGDTEKTKKGTVRGKIPIAEMYHRHLRSRISNTNHQ